MISVRRFLVAIYLLLFVFVTIAIPITPEALSASLPDLVVSGLAISPQKPTPSSTVSVSFTVRNNGSVAVRKDYKIQILIDDKVATSVVDNNWLAPNMSKKWSWKTTWPNDELTHKLTVVLDPDNIVQEESEDNNTASIVVSPPSVCLLTVEVSPPETGSVMLDPPGGSYKEGTTVKLVAVPLAGYHFVSWSGDVASSNNPISVVMDNDKKITAMFAVNQSYFTISASASDGGSISPEGNITVNMGDSQTFTITPKTGYAIEDVKVDGISVGAVSTYTFTNVIIDHTITATFKKESYPVPSTMIYAVVLHINDFNFTVNGAQKKLDSPPVINNGRTLVPIRAIIEAFGGSVEWIPSEQKITISLDNNIIEMWIGKSQANINKVSKWIDSADHNVTPKIIDGRAMVPIRFVSESLGAEVYWSSQDKAIAIVYGGLNKVIASGSKTFSSGGGELTLSDGSKLIVPSGAFSNSSEVHLASFLNPMFTGVGTYGCEITGIKNFKKEITFSTTIGENLSSNNINVFSYDFSSLKQNSLNFTYDSNSGIITVKINPNLYAQTGNVKIYIVIVPSHTCENKETVLRVPYYAQIGNSSASTCAQMLIASAGNYQYELFNILKELGVSDKSFSINQNQYMNNLRLLLTKSLGYPVVHSAIFNIDQLKNKVLSVIDSGAPVLLNLGQKTVLVVGYTDNGNSLVIHDPINVAPVTNYDGTMLTTRTWSWVKGVSSQYFILYPLSPLSVKSSLSVECPGKNESGNMAMGDMSFCILDSGKSVPQYRLQVKPTVANGYVWVDSSNNTLKSIPSDADTLSLSIPVFSTSTVKQNVTMQVKILQNKGGGSPGKEIVSDTQKIAFNVASFNTKNMFVYKHEFKMEDMRDLSISDQDGVEHIIISVSLLSGSSVIDSYSVFADVSVLPKVTAVTPKSGKVGDTITITGKCFGKNKSAKSRVSINGDSMEIVSWSDNTVKVKLSKDISSMNSVVVYTGEQYEYMSNTDAVLGAYEGTYVVQFNTPAYLLDAKDWKCKWIYGSRVDHVIIVLKDNKVTSASSKNFYNSYQEVTGTYDNKGNITFTFTIKDANTSELEGYVLSGTFSGKFVAGKSHYFEGTLKGTVRDYSKITDYACCPHDEKVDISISGVGSLYSS